MINAFMLVTEEIEERLGRKAVAFIELLANRVSGNRNQKHYHIIEQFDHDDLIAYIELALGLGWELFGPTQIIVNPTHLRKNIFYQCIVYNPTEKPYKTKNIPPQPTSNKPFRPEL